MIQQQVYIINTVLMFLDAIFIVIAGYGAVHFYHYIYDTAWAIDRNVIIASVILVVFINNYVMGKLNLYSDRRPLSYFRLLWAILKATIIDFSILSAAMFLFKQFQFSRSLLIIFAGFFLLIVSIERILARYYINRISKVRFNSRKLLVIGNVERGEMVSNALERQLSWGYEIIGRLSIGNEEEISPNVSNIKDIGPIEEIEKVLRIYPIDEVIFAMQGDRSVNISSYLNLCHKIGVPVKILPAMWEPGEHSLSVEKIQEVPFLTVQSGNMNATGVLYKRILDLTGGLIGTIILFLIYPLIAIAIKLDSPGPVFFKQQRIGKNGRIFQLYKFRSMILDAEKIKNELSSKNEMNGQIFKIKNDPRITKIGKWLRKTSLDEFPQFLNVLKGEMSLVGTRPPIPEEVNEYRMWQLKRISVKPGITGLWQISGRNQIKDFDKIVELDCRYIDQWRFFDDIKILFKTIVVVLQRKGAI